MTKAIVTGADSNYFPILKGLILSLLEQWHPVNADLHVFDFGLSNEEIKWLKGHHTRVESGINISRSLDLPLKETQAMATCLKAYLPRIFPGYQTYLWMDADTWVQDPIAIDHYFLLGDKKYTVAAIEFDRTYSCCYSPGTRFQQIYSWYKYAGFDKDTALEISRMPVINCGLFSADADSGLWLNWPNFLWRTITNQQKFYMADQTAFNFLIHTNRINSLILPAEYNWQVNLSAPIFSKKEENFLTPVPPHAPIKILNLSGLKNIEKLKLMIKGADGSKQYVPLTYNSKSYSKKEHPPFLVKDTPKYDQIESDEIAIREYAEKILRTKPIVCDPEGGLELHTLTCQRDLEITLWSLKTFYHYSEIRPRLVIYDDGSLSKEATGILSDHFLNCQIIRRDKFDHDMEDFLKAYRTSLENCKIKSFYCALKLFGPMYYTKSESFLYLDTDVLFFQKPREILEYVESKTPFFSSDYKNAYSNSVVFLNNLLNIDLVHKVNAGLFHINKQNFADNLDLVESYFTKVPDLKDKGRQINRHEQTLAAILLSKANAVRLSSDHQISRKPVTDKTISHHFVDDGSRTDFYNVGLKRLMSVGFIEEFEIQAQKNGAHSDMNQEEGHLGGYIRSRHSSVPTFYRFEHGDPTTYFPELWRWAVNELGVRSVLDVGCGEGHAARYFRDLGCRVLAVDGSVQAMRDSRVPEQHVRHDYTEGSFIPDSSFDLVWSCEFVEHIKEQYLDNFLATFSQGRNLMMTYADPGQPGHHHVNCQPEEYWIEKLIEIGFHFDAYRTRIAREVAAHGHFSQRGLVFDR